MTEEHSPQSASLEADTWRSACEPGNPWRKVLESSGDGVWDWDVHTNIQTFSPRWKGMLGYAEHEVGTGFEEFFNRVHPEDRVRLNLSNHAALQEPVQRNAIELRMRCKDGTWKWILSRVLVVIRDEQGLPLHVTGTHTDISERKAREDELSELNRQLFEQSELVRTTLASMSQGILMTDAQSRVTTFNPRACELLELPSQFLQTQPPIQEIVQFQLNRGDFGPDCSWVDEHARSSLRQLATDGTGNVPPVYLRLTRSGHTLEIRSQPLPTGGLVRTFTDVSDYVKAQTERRQLNALLDATQSMARVGGVVHRFGKEPNFLDRRHLQNAGDISPELYPHTRHDSSIFRARCIANLSNSDPRSIHPKHTV